MFKSVLNDVAASMSVGDITICLLASVVLGIIISIFYMNTGKYNKNFVIAIAILPILVQVIIMMVNGNLGTSVAILGAFSLVRFRSAPGNSREIVSIFYSMAVGLSLGMGHIAFACLITIVIGVLMVILYKTPFGSKSQDERTLKIVIPEDLDYENIFDDVFKKYLSKFELERTKITNMGSMYELYYTVVLKENVKQKEFLDTLRIRNSNLNISLGREMSLMQL